MGLTDKEVEMDKDRQIADLQRQLSLSMLKSVGTTETPKVAASDVNAVSVKLPPFTESNPELWFGKAEAQFVLRGIKDDTTKFYHIYANLTEKAMNEIEGLLLDPPATGKVAAVKAKLVRKFTKSQYQKDTELLNIRALGDLKPTEMWAMFQRNNKDPHNATSSFIKAYLINMYPPDVRVAIANMSFADNDEMAEAAERIMDMKRSTQINGVAQVLQEPDFVQDVPEIDAIGRGSGAARGRGSSRGRGQP